MFSVAGFLEHNFLKQKKNDITSRRTISFFEYNIYCHFTSKLSFVDSQIFNGLPNFSARIICNDITISTITQKSTGKNNQFSQYVWNWHLYAVARQISVDVWNDSEIIREIGSDHSHAVAGQTSSPDTSIIRTGPFENRHSDHSKKKLLPAKLPLITSKYRTHL